MAKFQLQRIESTLAQLDGTKTDTPASAASQPPQSAPSAPRSLQGYSFKIVPPAATTASQTAKISLPAQPTTGLPNLPKFKPPSISSHHHAANPALAMNLLKTLEAKVAAWQTELQQIMRQVQALYEEGPIIDGWLDTQTQSVPATPLRHAEVDRLMDYVQEICRTQPSMGVSESQAGYRLCGLDADGKLWWRPCPPEQLPQISLAIARYQKLRQLLARKQELENHLNTLAQALIPLQSHLQTLP